MATPASDPMTVGISTAVRQALDTAILFPTLSLTDGELCRSGGVHDIGPFTPVGGLSVFLRTVLTLQRAGIANIVVFGGLEEDVLKRLVAQESRVVAIVRWMPLHEFPLDDPRTWDVLAQGIEGPCLVIGARIVFSRGLIDELKRHVEESAGQRVVMAACGSDKPGAHCAEIMVVPAGLLSGVGWQAVRAAHRTPLDFIGARAAAEGRLQRIPISMDASRWCQILCRSAAVDEAEQRLLQGPKGAYDGVVDTYFNRKVANRLTRLFVRAGWSPNAITSLSILIGLLSAVLFAQGIYLAGVLGALLFQVSAIVDCCDGDVARLTFQESAFGERLDLIGDNVVHMAIFAALGWAGYTHGGGEVFLALALLAIIGNGLSLWFVTRVKARARQESGPRPTGPARSEFIVKHMASRDFSIVVLFFAFGNLLSVFLWLAAIGSNIFWMLTAWITRSPSLRA